MKRILAFGISLFLAIGVAYSTPQIPFFLIYQGDTLDVYPRIFMTIDRSHSNNSQSDETIASRRRYQTVLELRNDSLFLVKKKGDELLDLNQTLTKEEDMFLNWYSSALTNPTNIVIPWDNNLGGFYKNERDFVIVNGILEEVKEYVNMVRPSPYIEDDKLLPNFIKQSINYDILPKLEKDIRVIISVQEVNLDGKIEEVRIIRGHSQVFDDEAVRIVKSIPQWEVIVRRGEPIHRPFTIPIIFRKDKEN